MNGIKSFIFNLLVIALSCSAVNFLAPDNTKLSKYIQYVFALIITVILLSPLSSLFNTLPGIYEKIDEYANSPVYADSAEIFSSNIKSTALKVLEENTAKEIESRFSVKPEGVSIEATETENTEIIPEKVIVTFDKYNALLFSDVEKHLSGTLLCECEVIANEEENS